MAGLVIPIQLEGGGGARHTNTRSATTRAVNGTLRNFAVLGVGPSTVKLGEVSLVGHCTARRADEEALVKL